MIHALLVEDHELLRHGTRHVLEAGLPGVVIGEAGTTAEANEQLSARAWDLMILDVNLPGRSGLELLEELRAQPRRPRVLVLTAYPEEELALRCLRAGAAGYLTKASAATELLVAVRKILAGGRHVSQSLAEVLASELGGTREHAPHEALSARELQILKLVAKGRSLKEIGADLHLSEKTIATYRARVGEKLGVSRLADLARYAVRHGLVE